MASQTIKISLRRSFAILAAIIVLNVTGSLVFAADLNGASLSLSDSRPSQTSVSYTFDADNVTTSTIRCIRLEFDTAADGSGGKPTGMNIGSALLSGSSDYVPTPASWTVTNNDTTGVTTLTLAGGETPASASDRTVILTGITNGSTADNDFFLRFSTYNNTDCSTSPVDSVNVTFIYTTGQNVSLSVDPSLSFSIAGTASSTTCNSSSASTVATTTSTVPFGTVSTSANGIAVQNLTTTTNAGSGYTTFTRYTAAPTSGANSIDDHSGSNASPSSFTAAGTEAFGYTTNDSTLGTGTANRFTTAGGNRWAAFTASNAEVAYNAAAVASDVTCVGYQAGISGTTPAGTYTNTVIFTSTPIY